MNVGYVRILKMCGSGILKGAEKRKLDHEELRSGEPTKVRSEYRLINYRYSYSSAQAIISFSTFLHIHNGCILK
jgi:hypothetical protein